MKYLIISLIVILFSCRSEISYPEGGLDYPTNLTGKDTNYYHYPLLAVIPKSHRFWAYFEQYFYKRFDEPNLSVRPLAKETFRLAYSDVSGETIILSFTKYEIVIKRGFAGGSSNWDTTRLNKLENAPLEIFSRWYPFETKGNSPRIKRYLDSLCVLYPHLLDVNYYIELYDKVHVANNEKFTYQTKKIAINEKVFGAIVKEINNSGYWKLPHDVQCEDAPADGYVFTLEANTFRKYKVVSRSGCPSEKTDFPKLCQKIIVFAGLDKELKLDSEWKVEVVEPDTSSTGKNKNAPVKIGA